MNEYGVLLEPGVVRFQRLLPGPIERVWSYFTDADKRATWLAGGDSVEAEGQTFELAFRHADLSPIKEPTPEEHNQMEHGQFFRCRVLRFQPYTLLSWNWGEAGGNDSQVTFEFESRGERVLLTITHRQLASVEELIDVCGGWHTHLAIFTDAFAGRQPRPFWSTHEAFKAEYRRRIGGKVLG